MENLNKTKFNEGNIGMNDVEGIQIYKFILRNQKFLKRIIGCGVFISIVYAFLQKDIWQGEFQIVLEQKNSGVQDLKSDFTNKIEGFQNLGLGGSLSKSSLLTEVEVLKSPSVLMSVFNFVNDEKEKKDRNFKKKSFKTWTKNLNIELEKGTSVLNLEYKDTDKTLILPVLEKITNIYQRYSGSKYKTEMKKGLDYLDKQVNTYKAQSKNSLKTAQTFSMKYDLPFLGNNTNNMISDFGPGNKINIPPQFSFSTDVERNRVEYSNQLKFLDQQLYKLSKLQKPIEILYFAKNVNGFEKDKAIELVQINNIELSNLRRFYNENTKRISNLKRDQKTAGKFLKKSTTEFLKAQKNIISSNQKAFERPKGVIVKYQDLWKEANTNNMILNSLETQYIMLKLENAKDKDPWNLITNPTLLDMKVGPSRLNILLTWFFYTSLIGLLISYLNENFKNYIYNPKEIEKLMPFDLIETLKAEDKDNWNKSIEIFANGELVERDIFSIGILTLGENLDKYKEHIYNCLTKSCKGKNIISIDNITDIKKTELQILITASGSLKRNELDKSLRQLRLLNNSIVGWFLVEE